ncbi:unnamed protein product [Brassicogethes aeneus]|uniref:Chaoptin n=1 Tax=Brassicogethes aeneus TaxID=1431903 RepID=A0A9P0FGQ2_BRAAE|nr:unnamed protein product [Brassicogethes aeneus]
MLFKHRYFFVLDVFHYYKLLDSVVSTLMIPNIGQNTCLTVFEVDGTHSKQKTLARYHDKIYVPEYSNIKYCFFDSSSHCEKLKSRWFGIRDHYCFQSNITAENMSSSFIDYVNRRTSLIDYQVKLLLTNLNISNILPGSFDSFKNMFELYFDINNIQIIRKGVFNCLGHLKILSFKFNKVEIIEEGAFSGLEQLTHLNLKKNLIYHLNENIFYPLKNLYTLGISNNFINSANLSYFRFTSIKEFHLDHNKINSLQNFIFNEVSVNILDLSYNNVSVIEPEAFFKQSNLYDLNLNNNKLDKLSSSLHYLVSLKKLDLSYNNLQTISMGFFDHFNDLESLNLTHNNIISVRELNVLNVIYLGLAYNKLKDFDDKSLKYFPKLKKISLDRNIWECKTLLKEAIFSRSIVIEKGYESNLECSESNDTYKSTIDVKNTSFNKGNILEQNTPIMYLFYVIVVLQFTGYEPFCVEDRDKIYVPEYSNIENCFQDSSSNCNKFKSLWFGQNVRGCYQTNITEEILSSSFIKDVHSNTYILDYDSAKLLLTKLNISYILPRSFENYKNRLTELYFDINNIQIIKKGVFNSLGHLKILSFKFNKVETIEEDAFSGLEQLTHLNLKNNLIYHLNENIFYPLKKLYILSISNNFINSANQSYFRFTSIKEFYVDHNKINQLQNLMFNNVSVNILDISYNNVSVIEPEAFLNQSNLYDLSLNNNKLDKLSSSLHYLVSLKKLDLSYNNLQIISTGFFDHFNNLESLNLTHNNIISVRELNVLNVIYLGLAYNKLKDFDYKALKYFPKLRTISLDGNKWECKILLKIVLDLTSQSIVVEKGHQRNLSNILGIECSKSSDTTTNQPKTTIDTADSTYIGGLISVGQFGVVEVPLWNTPKTNGYLSLYNPIVGQLRRDMYLFYVIVVLQFTGYEPFCVEDRDNIYVPEYSNILDYFSDSSSYCEKFISSWLGIQYGDCYQSNIIAENISSSFIDEVHSRTFLLHNYNVKLLLIKLNIFNILPGSFDNFKRYLTELYFDKNNIQIIRKGVFNSLSYLTILSFKFNKVEIIEEDAFSGLEQLTHLNLKNNLIYQLNQNIFHPIKKLHILGISNNFINTANQSYFRFTSIKEFYVNHNKINQLQNFMFNNVSVNILDISYNNVSVIEPEAFFNQINLYDLSLNNNKLDKLSSSLHYLVSLKKLDLSYNNLQIISTGFFDHFNGLESLNLTHNNIISVRELNVLNVIYLGLAYNKLKDFDDKSLKYFPKLRTISLDGNKWECKILLKIVLDLTSQSIVVEKGHQRNLSNILGIECSKSSDTTTNQPKTTIDVGHTSFNKDTLNKDTLLDQNTPIVIILIIITVILVLGFGTLVYNNIIIAKLLNKKPLQEQIPLM